MRSPRLLAATLALLAGGCSSSPVSQQAAGTAPAPVAAPAVPAPPDTPATPTPTPSATPTPTPSPSPTKVRLLVPPTPAAPSYDVRAVQRQLTALHYFIGVVDGFRGSALRSAVVAFQKVQGLPADGSVGAATLAALKAPRLPQLKATSPATRVEIDLTRQVLYIVRAGAVSRILPVSSGSGRTYLQKNGHQAHALTPVGWYAIQRRIVGVHTADLGTLYDPEYFYKGWAIHGSNSVPSYPASHGCIRVSRADGSWLLGQIGVGTEVYVYGGSFTFPAGSTAPGTDNPTGDTPGDAPAASPTPTASAAPSQSGSPTPSGPASPAPLPSSLPPLTPTSSPSPSPTP